MIKKFGLNLQILLNFGKLFWRLKIIFHKSLINRLIEAQKTRNNLISLQSNKQYEPANKHKRPDSRSFRRMGTFGVQTRLES